MRQPITLEKMEATGRQFNVNAMARRIEVDNRIPLRYYYRIAESLLKQANIYREEKNIVDLYIILLRFSGLLSDTIPQHRDYQVSFQREKMWYRKKLYNIIDELESLKPEFHHRLSELNNVNSGAQQDPLGALEQSGFGSVTSSLYSGPCYKNISLNNKQPTTVAPQSWKYIDDHAHSSSFNSMQVGKQFKKLSLSLPPPKDETLSRHSFLGPNGLRGRWVGPKTETKVQYPSYADLTPETSSLNQNGQYGLMAVEDGDSQNNKSAMESVLSLDDGRWLTPADDSCSSLDDEGSKELLQLSSSIRQPSPPPVLAQMKQEFFPISPSKVADPWPGPAKALQHGVANSNSYKNLHIPVKMMDDFLRLAQENTAKNLETCGVLAGSLKNRVFHITTLIVPKQESTSDSCQTLNEEEIFEIQDKCSLFSLGWIHTHPSQTCFMSSVDLHTHYSYQIMLPEAIAIVMAPTDISSPQGIFNLSDPGGVSVIRNCQQRGFHPHEEPSDGSPIYEHCSHVYMNPNLKFDVVDLR